MDLTLTSDAALPERDAAEASQEARLVERARRDVEAFAQLYRLHYPAIARYVRRRVGDEHAAGDLVAETFLAALEGLGGYRQRGLPFRSWLYRLASTRVNRRVRRLPLVSHAPLEEEPRDPRAEREPAEVSAARRALLALPARYQSALSLHYMEGLSVAEVAAALGCRVGTIKARLSRGRDLLRARLVALEAKDLR